ncbi:MAG TPA: hypothetical protein VFH43_00065 [Candidatus Kapabacteria bacterium]|nr:hypothetical protein [Candidatus Kapabacteria bacterium]
MLATLSLAALLAKSAAVTPQVPAEAVAPVVMPKSEIVLELRPMTEEDRKRFPGRERFDKTEWYESQQKTVQTVIIPEYVEEWSNNGRDDS